MSPALQHPVRRLAATASCDLVRAGATAHAEHSLRMSCCSACRVASSIHSGTAAPSAPSQLATVWRWLGWRSTVQWAVHSGLLLLLTHRQLTQATATSAGLAGVALTGSCHARWGGHACCELQHGLQMRSRSAALSVAVQCCSFAGDARPVLSAVSVLSCEAQVAPTASAQAACGAT